MIGGKAWHHATWHDAAVLQQHLRVGSCGSLTHQAAAQRVWSAGGTNITWQAALGRRGRVRVALSPTLYTAGQQPDLGSCTVQQLTAASSVFMHRQHMLAAPSNASTHTLWPHPAHTPGQYNLPPQHAIK